ncbi:T9SS type A sorting domain-containing protein [Chitinophagaceae bacterium MMS25-I14]
MRTVLIFLFTVFGFTAFSQNNICFHRLHNGYAEILIPVSQWNGNDVTLKVYYPSGALIAGPVTYTTANLPKVTGSGGSPYYYLKGLANPYGTKTLIYEVSSTLDAAVSDTLAALPASQWSAAGTAAVCGVSKASVCFSRLHQGYAEMLVPVSQWHDTAMTLKVYHPNSNLVVNPVTYAVSSLPKVTSAGGTQYYYLKGVNNPYGNETLTYELSSMKDAAVSNSLDPLPQAQWSAAGTAAVCGVSKASVCFSRLHQGYAEMLVPVSQWHDTVVTLKVYHPNSNLVVNPVTYAVSSLPKVTAAGGTQYYYLKGVNNPYGNETLTYELSSMKDAAVSNSLDPLPQAQWSAAGTAAVCGVSKSSVCFSRLHQGYAEMLIPVSQWHDTAMTLKVYHPNSNLVVNPVTYAVSSLPKVTAAGGTQYYYLKGVNNPYGNETLTYELSSMKDAAVSNSLDPLPQAQWSAAGTAAVCGVSKASVCFSRLHQGYAEMLVPVSQWHDTVVTLKVYHPNSNLVVNPVTYAVSSLPKVTAAGGTQYYYLKGVNNPYGNETLTYELSSMKDAAVSNSLDPLPQAQWSAAGTAAVCGVSKASVCFNRLHQGYAEMLIPVSQWHDTAMTLKVYHPNSNFAALPVTYAVSSLPKVTAAGGTQYYYLKGVNNGYPNETLTYELSSMKDAAVSNSLAALPDSLWNSFTLQNTCINKPKGMCTDRNNVSYTIYLQKSEWTDTSVILKLYHSNGTLLYSHLFAGLTTTLYNNVLCYKVSTVYTPYANENIVVEVSGPKTAALHMYVAPVQQLCYPVGQCTNPVTPAFTQVAPVCKGTAFALPATSNDGYTGSWAPAINNQATTVYTFTSDAGQCAGNATMTVAVKNGITWMSGSTSQTLAANTPLTNIVYTLAGDATGTTVTGLPAGVTYVVNGTTLTISGTPSAAGTFNYTISTTTSCGTETATGSITVTAPVADWTLAPNSYIFTGKDKTGNSVDGLYIPVKKAYAMWAGGGDFMKDAQGNYTPIPSGNETAGLYWEDMAGLIKSITLEGSGENARIKVMVDKLKEGNAVVSYRVNGTVYWTWHVWVTDDPRDSGSTYHHGFEKDKNGTLVTDWKWMDRNLGATNASFTGHDWQRSGGLQYQWGRKDPFPPLVYKDGTFYEVTGEVGNLRHRNALYTKSVTEPSGQSSLLPVKFRGNLYSQGNTGSDLPNENIRYSVNNPINYIIPPVYVFKTGETVVNNGENYYKQGLNSQGQLVWNKKDLTTWFSKQKYKLFDPANSSNNIAWDLWGDTRQGRVSNINSGNSVLQEESKRYAMKSPYDPCPCSWRVPSAYASTSSYPNSSSPWGADTGTHGTENFLPNAVNASTAGVKIYPGLGYDFTGVSNWNLGIIPISGNYEYYPNTVSLGNNPTSGLTVPNVISQDQAADGALHTSTFSSGAGTEPIYGSRGIGFIADPVNKANHTSVGWYYIGYDGNEGNTYESAAVRCIKDPNNQFMPTEFETEFVAAATDEYSMDTLKSWANDPNSFVVMTNTTNAADRVVEIPLRKAYAMQKLYLTTDESYPSDGTKSGSVVWTTNTGLINNMQIIDGTKQTAKLIVTLNAGQYGNTIVAFHLGNSGQWVNGVLQDPVIWSWHIWAPETPVQTSAADTTETITNSGIVQVANNQFVNPTQSTAPPLATTFMDRDLGALTAFPALTSDISISAADLQNVMKASGVHYQWGRKDALPRFTNPGNLFAGAYQITGGNAGFDHSANGDTAFVYVQTGVNNGAITYQKFNESRFVALSQEYQTYKSAAGVAGTDSKNARIKKVTKYAAENPMIFLYQARPLSAIEQNPNGTYTDAQRNQLNSQFATDRNKNPTDWLSEESGLAPERWGHGTAKSPFDPCPKGWRIPDVSFTFSSSVGTAPWFYNYYDVTANNVRTYGLYQGGGFTLTGRGRTGIISNTNNTITQAEYPGNVVAPYSGAVSGGTKMLGNVFSFPGSNYSIGNFANSGTRGILGGNSSTNPVISYSETIPSGFSTGIWTSAFSDYYRGLALGMGMQTTVGTQAKSLLTVTGLFHPQTAMSCRCAKMNFDANGHEIGRYDPYAIPVPQNGSTARKASKTLDAQEITQLANENKIIVFPNPVKDVLRILADDTRSYYYQIYNIAGKLVQQGEFVNKQTDISSLPPGAYLVRINNAESVVKIIKQ